VALGYFVGIGGMPIEPTGLECYEQYPVMRRWCEEAESWTGIEMQSLFAEDHTAPLIAGSIHSPFEPPDLSVRPEFLYRGQVRQAVHVLGISDILAEQGVQPDLIVGTSLGGLIAACLAGSLDRKDLFRLFARVAEMPLAPAGEPARGIAMIELPPGTDIDWYCGAGRPHINMAADFQNSGENTLMMLSGYLEDLEHMAADAPPGHVQVVTGAIGAVHCPDLQFMADMLEPFLAEIDFRDPEIPLLCGVGGEKLKTGAQLATGDEIRRSVVANYVAPVGGFREIIAALGEHGMGLVVATGAKLPVTVPPGPFPLLQASEPDDIGQIMMMLYDLGLVGA